MDEWNILIGTRTIATILACLVTEGRGSRVKSLSIAHITIRLDVYSQEDTVIHEGAEKVLSIETPLYRN
jgi:hypothetical protein